jgi:hypothetical protein
MKGNFYKLPAGRLTLLLIPFLFSTACTQNTATLAAQIFAGAKLSMASQVPMNSQLLVTVQGIDPSAVVAASVKYTFYDQSHNVLTPNYVDYGSSILIQLDTNFAGQFTVSLNMSLLSSQTTIVGSTNVINTGAVHQSIYVVGAVTTASGGPVAVLSNNPANVVGIPAFIGGQSYNFDFTKTVFSNPAVSPNPSFQYQVDLGQGFYSPSNAKFAFTFPASASLVSCRVEVTDTVTNISQTFNFIAIVSCGGSSFIDVSQANISIAHSISTATNKSAIGFYDYSVSGLQGGTGSYNVAFDLNGDGIQDQLWSTNGYINFVNGTTVKNQFTFYNKNRPITVFVTDSCNNFATLTQNINFDIPTANATPGQLQLPQIPAASSFLQAQFSGAAYGNNEPSANAFISTVDDLAAPIDGQNRINVWFNLNSSTNGSLTYQALNSYKSLNNPNAHEEGLVLSISNFTFGSFVTTNASLTLWTDAGTDGSLYPSVRSYTQSAVPISINTTSTSGSYACPNNVTGTITQYSIDYTLGTTSLTDLNSGLKVNLLTNTGAGGSVVSYIDCPYIPPPPNPTTPNPPR